MTEWPLRCALFLARYVFVVSLRDERFACNRPGFLKKWPRYMYQDLDIFLFRNQYTFTEFLA